MELRRLIVLAWRWLWLIVMATLIAGGLAFVASKQQVPVYEASCMLLVSQAKAAVMMDTTTAYAGDRLSATYAELLGRRPVITEVIRNLDLNLTPDALSKAVTVKPIQNTQLIRVSVEDTNPERAAAAANEIPAVFIEQNEKMQTSRFADLEASLQGQIRTARDDIARQQQIMAELKTATEPDQTEIDRQQRDLTEMQSNYSALYRSYDQLKADEANQLDTLIITEQAERPTTPIRPKTGQNTLLAAMIGALIAVGGAFVIEYLDDGLKDPDQIKATLGLPTLTGVPVINGQQTGNEIVLLSDQHSSATEAYRRLRTNLQFAAVGKPLSSMLISSPSKTEGKSLTAANLGVALAQAGQRVILVDADLYRPRLHRIFKLRNNVGLTSALIDDHCTLQEILQQTELAGLRILASGPLPPDPADLLGSGTMRRLVESLKSEADFVLLDSPPVMAVSDAAVLATLVDGVLLVLDASRSRRELAKRAVAGLQQVQARLVGVVLNRVPTRGVDSYYSYYGQNGDYYAAARDAIASKGDHRAPRRNSLGRIWGRLCHLLRPLQALFASWTR